MGEPMWVNVMATDPVLEAGVTSAMLGCPDIAVVTTREKAAVTVLVVDHLGQDALDSVRAVRTAADRPEVVLVVPEVEPADALRAIAAGARGLLRRREATAERLTRTVLAAGEGTARSRRTCSTGCSPRRRFRPAPWRRTSATASARCCG